MATILLADDDASVRDLVSRALKSDGHVVHVTHDGGEALEHLIANAAAIDLIVSDVDMPQLDGISLAGKALKLKPNLGIVLMSGFAGQLDRASDLDGKRIVSISKPFTLEQIRQVVKQVLA